MSAIGSESGRRLTVPLMAHVDKRMRAELEVAARENERSIGAEVRLALRRHLAGREGSGR
jgi:hypothetical protein